MGIKAIPKKSIIQNTSLFVSLVFDPLSEFPVGPDSLTFVSGLGVDNPAISVLHAFIPFATVLATVGIGVGSFSMFLVESVLAFIAASILPDVQAFSVHDALLEGTLEVAAIGPLETSVATHLVVRPRASVLTAIGPEVTPFAFFDTTAEITMIVAAITPDFDALAVLFVLGARHFRC